MAMKIWQVGDKMVMKTHFLFMTRLLDGDMQLTLISVVPCLLQIAIEKRPKFARITCNENMRFQKKKNKSVIFSQLLALVTLMVWSEAQEMVSCSPSHL